MLASQPLERVDRLGWHGRSGIIAAAALPGLARAVRTQYNVVVDLAHFPSARHLRQILVFKADLAQQAARL